MPISPTASSTRPPTCNNSNGHYSQTDDGPTEDKQILDYEQEHDTSEDSTSEDDSETIAQPTARMQLDALEKLKRGQLDLESDAGIELFNENYKECLTGGRDGDTLIHLILRERESYEYPMIDLFLKACFRLLPTILEVHNGFGETPLHEAIRLHSSWNLERLVSKTSRSAQAQAIACAGPNNGNCLHAAIKHKRDDALYLIEVCDKSSLVMKDDDTRTPLHYAVQAEYYTSQQPEIIKGLLTKCPDTAIILDKGNLSAYHMSQLSWDGYNKTPAELQDVEARKNHSKLRQHMFQSLCPTRKQRETWERIKIEDVLQTTIEHGRKIQHDLKMFILRRYDPDTCVKVLYKEGEERELVFDLTEFQGSTPEDLLARLANLKSLLDFDDIIAYVTIPKLGEREDESQDRENLKVSPLTDKPQKRIAPKEAVTAVFQLLRESGVKKIMRVVVEDPGNPPYDDDTIQAALSGFDIDDWDWKTQDVCVEIINQVAPNVRSLKLYPSGNDGVFQSWSGPDGLIRLSQLREVTLVVGNTVQSRERTLRNIESFWAQFSKETGREILITVKDGLTELVLPTNLDEKRRRGFLQTLSRISVTLDRSPSLKSSKVALITDGVEPMCEKVVSKIKRGRSFAYLANGRIAPWWVSSSGHGSVVAEILCEFVNPIELYVARLGTNPDNPSSFVASAAQAIRWAVSLDVDIVCLGGLPIRSWQANTADAEKVQDTWTMLRQKNIVFMTLSMPSQEPGAGPEEIHARKEITNMFYDAGALRIATIDSKQRAADFRLPGQCIAPAIASRVHLRPDLDVDLASLALATSLATQILNLRRSIQHEARGGENLIWTDRKINQVELVKEVFKRLQDEAGDIWLGSNSEWLYCIPDGKAIDSGTSFENERVHLNS
ncbi:hypothetical protein F5Y10DRAFT_271025 [Nemania abortiva]|nr:hypothetical protein F5Y10DRAFT_271025 [Nemania abortiva]